MSNDTTEAPKRQIDDGGQAFPMIRDQTNRPNWDYEGGMSLRDYFAAKMAAAWLSSYPERAPHPATVMSYDTTESARERLETVADQAYTLADAMLRVRGEA